MPWPNDSNLVLQVTHITTWQSCPGYEAVASLFIFFSAKECPVFWRQHPYAIIVGVT